MGAVIPFEPRGRARTTARPTGRQASEQDAASRNGGAEQAPPVSAAGDGGDCAAILAAAVPLLRRCSAVCGLTVMRTGLPDDPARLRAGLLQLSRAAALIEARLHGQPASAAFGVYLGQPRLAWFEDGYGGATGLAVPLDASPEAITDFVGARLAGQRSA